MLNFVSLTLNVVLLAVVLVYKQTHSISFGSFSASASASALTLELPQANKLNTKLPQSMQSLEEAKR